MFAITPSCNTDQGVLLTCEFLGVETRGRKETERGGNLPARGVRHHRPITIPGKRFEYEHVSSDPKGDELYVSRMKPRETLVEVRSGSNVQIDRQTYAKGRKTNRIT
jgi:hypothetical protein